MKSITNNSAQSGSVLFIAIVILFSSCKTLNTNLSIPKKELPSAYRQANSDVKDTANIANISWKKYFSDTLLVKLIDTALVNNMDLQMAFQRIEIARSGIRFANGALFPTISATGFAGTNKYAKYTPDYAGNSTTEYEPGKIVPNPLQDYSAGFLSSWELDVFGKLQNQRRAAISNYFASIEGKNFVVTSLVADVAISYYELLALDNELQIIQQTILKQQEALEVIKLQKETGRANELAVQQFNAQLLNSQALEKEILQQITETENRINFLLGRFPQTIQRKKENLFFDIPLQIATGIPSDLLKNRPDIRDAEFLVQASKFDLKSAQAAFFPSFNITAGYGFQSFNPQFLFLTPASLAYSLLGNLTTPLINRSAIQTHFNTAKANQLTAMYGYYKAILNGYMEVLNELSGIENLQQINLLKRQQSDVLKQSVETSTELYKTAKANYLEVLLAQQNALQTQLELVNVNKRQQISIVNIYKALGGGWK